MGGFDLRALTRNPASPAAAKLAQSGVEVRGGGSEAPAHAFGTYRDAPSLQPEHSPGSPLKQACTPGAPPLAQVVKADFDDPASLAEAFKNVDSVFAVTDFWQACGLDASKELAQGEPRSMPRRPPAMHACVSRCEDGRAWRCGAPPSPIHLYPSPPPPPPHVLLWQGRTWWMLRARRA